MDHIEALEKAKIDFMMLPDTVFYTTILFSLKQEWNNKVSTAGIDGTSLLINPDFFLTLNKKERVGLLAHEVMHVALNHITRKGKRDPKIYNMAGDYVINLLLKNYTLPNGGLYDTKFTGMSTEQVYDYLIKHSNEIPDNVEFDIIYPSKEDIKNIEEKIVNTVLKAVTQTQIHTKGYSNIPSDSLVILDKTINPKLPWNVILQNYMQQFNKENYSMSRPNRRYAPEFYLPQLKGEALCNLTIFVDSSGSVLPKEFSYFISEIDMIKQYLKPGKITVIDFDTKIRNTQKIEYGFDINDLKFTGRGGTSIEPVFKWINDNNPDLVLIFTDGDFDMSNLLNDNLSPIIWLIHNNKYFKSPIGEIIHYDINGVYDE
jgi:predicted metal-dependent peptidase